MIIPILFFIFGFAAIAAMFAFGVGGLRAADKCQTCEIGYREDFKGCSYCGE